MSVDIQNVPAASREAPHQPPRRWPLAYYLAALGAVYFFVEIWTLTAWLSDGVHEVTAFRDPNSVDAHAAMVYQILAVILAIGVMIHLVRSCMRERRLTFDAKFCIMGFLLYFVDPFANWAQPTFYYSSNWVNLANWCGHAPLMVNPDCGRLPEPVLFLWLLYTFAFLLFAMGMNKVMGAIKRWRPTISTIGLIGTAFGIAMLIDAALELPMIAFKLWYYPGWPLSLTGSAMRYPFAAPFIASILFTGLASVRYFKDDKGRTIVERGIDHLKPATRSVVVILALIGISQGCATISCLILVANGPYMQQYPRMPAWLVNDMCDAPGITGTAYGPCPGSPGYLAPLRRLPDHAAK
jgi:hypothetical protein